MKTGICRLTIHSCFALFAASIAQADIVNPGFEDGWTGWSTVSPSGEGAAISDEANDGEKSAKLTEKSAYVSQTVTVLPNSGYRLGAFVKGVGNLGVKVGPDIYFEQLGKKSRKWKWIEVTFQTGDATEAAIFGSNIGAEGRFDDFSLEPIEGEAVEASTRVISSSSGGYGLSPDLPPGRNFDLLGWYLSTPADDDGNGVSDRLSETELEKGVVDERYFFTADDGGMAFRATIGGAKTSKNTRFTRSELREMLRRGDTSIKTRNEDGTPNANNWVFSSAPDEAKKAAGAVDGSLKATLAVNKVTEAGEQRTVGAVVIGQIHASKDEPARLYYRKMPEHRNGSLFVAHEVSGGDDTWFDLLGSRTDRETDPEDGVPLDEKFSYEITVRGNSLYVAIFRHGKLAAETTIDMSDSGYDVADDYMYFKAGAYNQNNSDDLEDFVQVTFYELEASHP